MILVYILIGVIIMPRHEKAVRPLYWEEDSGTLVLLDQTKLPGVTEYVRMTNVMDVWDAIKQLQVRGAPAIGIAASYGVYIGVRDRPENDQEAFYDTFVKKRDYLAASRPTAVNLFWALKRMTGALEQAMAESGEIAAWKRRLLQEAHAIREEDERVCRQIGANGLSLLRDGMGILTHCNAGGLAASKYGTALSPIYLAHEKGWKLYVFADETRPLLQGARLTTWELMQAGVDVTLICDNMAASVMAQKKVQAVMVGCDRVAANGDVANKIGTYGLAILARAHDIPFYVACPLSTIDMDTPTGAHIPIEEREPGEITEGFGKRTAPLNVRVYNPAFDVTPHDFVTAFVTERGVVQPPFADGLKKLFEEPAAGQRTSNSTMAKSADSGSSSLPGG